MRPKAGFRSSRIRRCERGSAASRRCRASSPCGARRFRRRHEVSWTGEGSPFHGEQALQARSGARDEQRADKQVIRNYADQHRHFFATQPLLFVSNIDARRGAGLTSGPDSWARPIRRRWSCRGAEAGGDRWPRASPRARLGLSPGFATRRNRANGRVTRVWPLGFECASTRL
jgi:hypothetical protein